MIAIKRTLGFINNHPLAKKHLLLAYFNLVKWQINSRIYKGLIKVPFVNDVSFYARKRLTGITGNIYTGLHEFNDMGFVLHFLKEGDVFYDVGANVGSYTLLASGVTKATTLAFEPINSTFEILSKNIELNELSNLVELVNKGVGKTAEILLFSTTDDTTNHVIIEEENIDGQGIEVINLDYFEDKYSPALIKIDVEGYELEVLDGANKTLINPELKAIIIEIIGGSNLYGHDMDSIHKKLISFNFKPYSYNPFTRVLEPALPYIESNTIYIRDIDFVTKRVSSAKSFYVFKEYV
ncbi:FkbM family methyltransferase [Pedobacter lithocola]|uniref:FkbM family methyltransferase n=1 Tax=Pedobacter lithocola TaxID=1908239 RepID=A0ABV8PAY1_9SPHI